MIKTKVILLCSTKLLFVLWLVLFFCFFKGSFGQQYFEKKSFQTGFVLCADTPNSNAFQEKYSFSEDGFSNSGEAGLARKIFRGTLYSTGYDIVILSGLAIAPESFSKWEKGSEKFKFNSIKKHLKNAYTTSPVVDNDHWITNYVGHPYQGAFYYNSLRSQDCSVLQSSAFCLAQSLIWEYGWEACFEQPSIQDLIVTPLGGVIVGELVYAATNAMGRKGFTWYEKIVVCLINPAYVINCGFHFNKPRRN
ncbi:protein of unknown function [Mariniphaga anaerophila]|uniref:DUF3943 domain-containing protein n=1 Tax=Mariniphaga anaerophila TaxID=1484053 RepID=A0A1M4TNB1_9BACT|nr:DUF3943 domain-containing protein [Mariniphaga anaerophila]SHE45989.1 protein of unknown function [Mariniphaga anaerophila]